MSEFSPISYETSSEQMISIGKSASGFVWSHFYLLHLFSFHLLVRNWSPPKESWSRRRRSSSSRPSLDPCFLDALRGLHKDRDGTRLVSARLPRQCCRHPGCRRDWRELRFTTGSAALRNFSFPQPNGQRDPKPSTFRGWRATEKCQTTGYSGHVLWNIQVNRSSGIQW